MKDFLKVVGLLVLLGGLFGAYPMLRCAAYDYDWRCMVGDCRIVKCSDSGDVRVERGD